MRTPGTDTSKSIIGAIAVAAAVSIAATAGATEVNVPKATPQVRMDVPDGWSVAYTDIGVELRSPEKDSVVVATMLKRDMAAVDAWKAKVFDRMAQNGVSVDKAAKAPPPPPASVAAAPRPASSSEDLPGTATTPSFAAAGGPSLDIPSFAKPSTPAPGAAAPGGHKAPATINGLHFQSYRLLGGMFKNKPTDMQLVLYAMPRDEFFAIEQQSAPDDNRAAAILNSVKALQH